MFLYLWLFTFYTKVDMKSIFFSVALVIIICPPLSKGGGLTARHKPLYFCFLLVPRPPFLFTKPFCRQDGGIASPLCFAPHSYRPLSKVRCCRRKNSGDYRRDCHTYRTLSASLTPPLTIPHSVPNPRKTAPSHSLFVLRVRQPHFPEK